ncbi:uncharacterized protein PFL1_04833 [Pseudozyma flocculosa PF-1]|uniref:Golgi apparatus membrane protein TVP38 n=2 Tax=Pseudozyma flocculosa TaxID=84751 RepID=A0A5C3F408_9BASI|nr:uncharacterized protein PFL1_04833 [Pseudozyma flocculosa PF-1]EPQ27695.1 hypothetical protein PFL1_04833 [Pseudozyma flocculosa PF-1]SPO39168.1 uncharacterized protein PSFLO_04647 [Pseudozyma flocculosa]
MVPQPQHLSAGQRGSQARTPSPLARNAAAGPARRPAAHALQEASGATPNFELPTNPMFADVDRWDAEASTSQQPSTSSPFDSRSRSVPPLAFDGGASLSDRRQKAATRKLPPIDTVQRPGSKRRSLFGESEKRPASPHITSATPTSASHHHAARGGPVQRIASPHDDVGGESFTIEQALMPRRSSTMTPPVRQTSLSRVAANTAHSLMDAVTGRMSPAVRHGHGHSHSSKLSDRESISDDEAGKGHGKRAAGRFTPTVYRNRNEAFSAYPRGEKSAMVSFQDDAGSDAKYPHLVAEPDELGEGFGGQTSWRASLSESRRATPAAYRPRPGTPRKRGSGGHADDSTDVVLPASQSSSHSIHIGSPIVVPQARRGAIRLKPRRRRRSSRSSRADLTFRQRCYMFCASVAGFLRLLANPVEAGHRLREWLVDTRIYWDDAFRDPITGARCWRPAWLQAYVPLLIWLGISLSSTAMVITFHTEVFTGLDRLAAYLQELGLRGRLLLGSLIFITTFPPLPLYSTLIILCGFSFGLWQGFIISYISALSGAIVVFLLSRSLLKDWMVGLLNQSGGLKKVVRAIEKQPKLLFLVRLAPYPYNLMNTLLASSQTLTLKTYTTCTALALPKLLVHTGLGTSIKNFAAYNGVENGSGSDGDANGGDDDGAIVSHSAERVKQVAGFVGVGLCIGIFIYLLQVARKAVDELDDEGCDDGCDDGEASDLGESDDLLSGDSGDEGGGGQARESDGVGMDMRERYGPGSQGFRNGYAPILGSAEERLREQMRHSVVSFEHPHSSHSMEDVGSAGGSGGGPSIDLAEKIAEMEAHAEGMGLEGVSGSQADGGGVGVGGLPDWLHDAESPSRSDYSEDERRG